MAWAVELTTKAADTLDKLDTQTRNRIWRFLRRWLAETDNPRERGKALTGRYVGLWRYRVGDYRLVCQLQDARLVVLVVEIAHRSDAYKGKPCPR